MRKEWLIAAAVLLAGCASIRPQVLNGHMASPAPGAYPVTVERGKWAGINSVPLGVYVDGSLAATVGGGQAVTVYLPEGRHIIGVGAHGSTPEKGEPSAEIAIDVSAASKPILHSNVSGMGYGGWKIQRVAQ